MATDLFRTKVLVRPNFLRCCDPNFVKGVFFGGGRFQKFRFFYSIIGIFLIIYIYASRIARLPNLPLVEQTYTSVFKVYTGVFEIYTGVFEIYTGVFEILTGVFKIYACVFEIYNVVFEI